MTIYRISHKKMYLFQQQQTQDACSFLVVAAKVY